MFANLILLYKILPPSVSYLLFIPLGFIGVYRWIQYIIKFTAYCLYKPIVPDFENRTLTPEKDVTIIVPTIDHDTRLLIALKTWLACNPYEVIFVTIEKVKPFLEEIGREADPTGTKVRVLTVPAGNKRKQMVKGASEVKTSIIVFCDDDVQWPNTMLDYCLAPFEIPKVGAVGTSQSAIPDGNIMTVWEIFASYRLTMRNLEIASTSYIDSGVSCLSGRTAVYRTCIIQDPAFSDAFLHEYWLGKYHQHSGDDKFLTRWIQTHNWRTWIQACDEVELITSFKPNYMFLIQLLRWTRNTWRSDIRALFFEKVIWSTSPWTAYSMFDRLFNPLSLIYGIIFFLYRAFSPNTLSTHLPKSDMMLVYFLWFLLIRFIKYLPHLIKNPKDLPALPLFVCFQYVFIFMKIYCLFTLHDMGWGTRAGSGGAYGGGHVASPPRKRVTYPARLGPDDEKQLKKKGILPAAKKTEPSPVVNKRAGRGRSIEAKRYSPRLSTDV